jgi:hypothetical protein
MRREGRSYVGLTAKVKPLVEEIVQKEGVRIHSVTARVKEQGQETA